MKKIIVSFLVSLVCFLGYAQTPYPSPNPFGSKGTMTQAQGGWKIDSTAIMPVYADTFAANRSKTSLYPGALIRVSDDYYYRSADTSKWLLLATTTSNCAGTQLISGSITWSGSGLVYDATDLDYYILCSRYFANSTTLTLATADPTFPRIDKFYADITGNIGVITGTPSANPQEPAINPLTQIDMGFVYIPAGSTVPAGTTQTVIYNENVEWSGTSNVPSVNFTYGTNPYIGSVSTYLPSAPNSSYVEWQSGGIDYLFSDAQYLKFWVRLNANFVSDPLSFLDVTFEYTDVTVSQTLAVGDGDYNMDYSLINQWQLVSIPLTGITTFGTEFNSVHFVINSAPTSFQLDYVYLLETATVPPVISSGWSLNLNTGTNPTTNGIGTSDSVGVAIKTNSQTRLIFPANGIVELSNDELDQQLLTIRNDTIYKTNIPTAYGTLPIVVEVRNDSTFITCPTCDTTGGGGSQNLFQVTHVGNSTDTSIVINGDTPNNGGILYFDNAANGSTYLNSSAIGSGTLNSYLGWISGDGSVGDINTFVGAEAGSSNNGSRNTFVGEGAGVFNDGTLNTFLGENTGYNNAGDSNVFLGNRMGYNNTGSANILIGVVNFPSIPNTHRNVIVLGNGENLASTDSQFVIAPYVSKMFLDLDSATGTAPAIAGIDKDGNWRKYATPAGATLTNTYVGVGNGAGISGGPDLTFDGGILRTIGINMAGGDMDSVSNIFGGSYYGIWAGDPVGEVYGGTGQSAYTTGDLIYASATNTLSKLGIGTAAQSLKVVGGIPAWKDTLAVSGVYAPLNSPTLVTPVLGDASATSLTINGTGGSGFVKYLTQSSAPGTPASGFSLYADASNRLSWKGANGYVRTFDGTGNTADRNYTLPDASGTLALTASPTFTGTVNGAAFTGSGAGTFFNVISTGYLRAAATSFIAFNTRSVLYSSADGKIEAKNWANTGFSSVESLYHRFGSGSPEGVVTAPIGCIYSRTDGGAGTSLYVKESGTGNTGWVAK